MFQCGVGLGICRLILASFDLSVSLLRIGDLLGKPFREKLGVREGAVESPSLFSMYINPLRQRLENQHPHLCRLLHVTVAVLLYADDAALPADSIEDLTLSAAILEQFCNEMHLYISTAKTKIIAFYPEGDTGVHYNDESLIVDGSTVEIKIYGHVIKAASSFKYLGVHLSANGKPEAH
eukprot:492500-Karenia_brevis.AAC.1